MSLVRWSAEGGHDFSSEIEERLRIYDLQGLLMDGQWNPTTAVEAYEYAPDDDFSRIEQAMLRSDKMYVRACFSEGLGIPFFALFHKTGTEEIDFYQLEPNRELRNLSIAQRSRRDPAGFLKWWSERKGTIQTKEYRIDIIERIRNSYYDTLLEENGMKWGGNIDGYLVGANGAGRGFRGIIEKRYTNHTPIASYDPAGFFRCGGGDYNTWLPLYRISRMMDVPLILFTFSNRPGEGSQMGMTIVTELSQNGIVYLRDENGEEITPCRRLCRGAEEAEAQLARLLSIYYGDS